MCARISCYNLTFSEAEPGCYRNSRVSHPVSSFSPLLIQGLVQECSSHTALSCSLYSLPVLRLLDPDPGKEKDANGVMLVNWVAVLYTR